jgi:hypothetical protein
LASKRYNNRDEPDSSAAKRSQNALLDINPEGDLLREIKDIIDELFIMMQIKTQEETVARAFVNHMGRIMFPRSVGGENSVDNRSEKSFSGELRSPNMPSLSLTKTPTIHLDHQNETEDDALTMTTAVELLDRIENQLFELGYLKEAAENASTAVSAHFTLKDVPKFSTVERSSHSQTAASRSC